MKPRRRLAADLAELECEHSLKRRQADPFSREMAHWLNQARQRVELPESANPPDCGTLPLPGIE